MKQVLALLLILSLATNVWLLANPEPQVADPSPAGENASAPVAATDEPKPRRERVPAAETALLADVERLSGQVSELQSQLAEARSKSDRPGKRNRYDEMFDPKRPLVERLRLALEVEPEKDRSVVLWKLGKALAKQEGSAAQVLAAVRDESDPVVLDALARLLGAGAAAQASPADRREFARLLREHPNPLARAAAVYGTLPPAPPFGKTDPAAQAATAEAETALIGALRTEESPEVIGAVGKHLATGNPGSDLLAAMRGAAARLPASDGRRRLWQAIGRGSFSHDAGASLVADFQAASDPETRDDIAAAIARASNSMSTGGVRENPEEAARRLADARMRFRTVFGDTSDEDVRRRLLRGAFYGLRCITAQHLTEDERAGTARFLREIAALDPDADQRRRIEQLADEAEQNGPTVYQAFRTVMYEAN